MLFLSTRTGLVSHRAIVKIGAINTRTPPIQSFHEIDYVCGTEARSTTATADAVADFLDELQ